MKHTLKRVSSLLLALCITMLMSGGQFVMASDLTVSVTYQQNTASWKIDGTAGISAHTAVTLKVYRTELGSLCASDILANGGFVKLVYTSSGGAFTDTVSLGTFFPSGSYTVEVSASGHTSATASFMHVNPDEAAGIIENVNPTYGSLRKMMLIATESVRRNTSETVII